MIFLFLNIKMLSTTLTTLFVKELLWQDLLNVAEDDSCHLCFRVGLGMADWNILFAEMLGKWRQRSVSCQWDTGHSTFDFYIAHLWIVFLILSYSTIAVLPDFTVLGRVISSNILSVFKVNVTYLHSGCMVFIIIIMTIIKCFADQSGWSWFYISYPQLNVSNSDA